MDRNKRDLHVHVVQYGPDELGNFGFKHEVKDFQVVYGVIIREVNLGLSATVARTGDAVRVSTMRTDQSAIGTRVWLTCILKPSRLRISISPAVMASFPVSQHGDTCKDSKCRACLGIW